MAFYVESVDRPPRSGIVAEDIPVGTGVAYDSSNNLVLFDAQNHNAEDFLGVADFLHTSEAISADDEDNDYGTFQSAENDRASAFGDEDGGVIKLRTVPETTDGVTTAPDVSNDTVVGFVDTSVADAPDAAGYIVEEGYTNDENDDTTTTTFNRSNDNFVAIGKVDRDSTTEFDDPVRVKVDAGL